MRRTLTAIAAGAAVLAIAVPALAASRGHRSATPATASASSGSRLDDGKRLLPKAKISEQDAIAAAQSAASGSLDEVDLEYRDGTLVFNVDVGAKDVKVDAASGDVVAVDQDD